MNGLLPDGHYLNQCWLIISKVLWHSSEGNFVRDASATFTNIGLKITNLTLHLNLPGANELTYWGLKEMADILQTTISIRWMTSFAFRILQKYVEVQITISWNIASGNGLALSRQQATAWTKDANIQWCHMALLSHSVLILLILETDNIGSWIPIKILPVNNPYLPHMESWLAWGAQSTPILSANIGMPSSFGGWRTELKKKICLVANIT